MSRRDRRKKREQKLSEEEQKEIDAYIHPSDQLRKDPEELRAILKRRQQRFWELQEVSEGKALIKFAKNLGIDLDKVELNMKEFQLMMRTARKLKAAELKYGAKGITPEKFEEIKKELLKVLGEAGKKGPPMYH